MTEAQLADAFKAFPFATADNTHGSPPEVQAVLASVRQALNMDVIFVSRFSGGRRHFAAVDTAPGARVIEEGQSDPLEESWCQRVATGRVPQFIKDAAPLVKSGAVPATPLPIGTHLSVPITLPDGTVHGTVCAFCLRVNAGTRQRDLAKLRAVADVVARRLAEARK